MNYLAGPAPGLIEKIDIFFKIPGAEQWSKVRPLKSRGRTGITEIPPINLPGAPSHLNVYTLSYRW